jgi:hypothetical protein
MWRKAVVLVNEQKRKAWKAKLKAGLRRAFRWGERIPFGLRSILGILLMIGGVFGFLPILGFWMLPLGAVLVCLDIPPLRRRLHNRLMADEEPTQRALPRHLP